MKRSWTILILGAAFLAPVKAVAAGNDWPAPVCSETRFNPESAPLILLTSTNRPPRISGTPGTRVRSGEDFVFLPSVTDPDNDRLQFFVANQPEWMQFNREWGSLSGIPTDDDIGIYPNISISVSDGKSAPVSLPPFTVIVTGADGQTRAKTAAAKIVDPIYSGIPLSTWIRAVETGQVGEKRRALLALQAMGPEAAPAVPALSAVIRNTMENPLIRAGAATALGRIGRNAKESVPHLIRYMMEGNALAVESAAEALGHIGEPAAVPFLANHLDRPESAVTRKVAAALGEIGPAAYEAVPHLIRAMKSGNEQAAEALGHIAEAGSIPALVAALSDWRVAYGAAGALERIGGDDPRIVSALMATLESGAPEPIRTRCAEVLGSFGPKARNAVPALVRLLKAGTLPLRTAAAEALISISTEKESGIPILVWALSDSPDVQVRRWAAEALGRLGFAALDAVPALVKALDDPDPAVRQEADKALKKIQGKMAEGPAGPDRPRLAAGKK